MQQKVYIGSALKYPLEFNNGIPALQYDDALIQQSITILLNTPVGTKFMLPEYGSRLRELVFEQNDEVLEDMITFFVAEAIGLWEKRIKFVSTEFVREDKKPEYVGILIAYRNLKSNEINSFVYPFYKTLKY